MDKKDPFFLPRGTGIKECPKMKAALEAVDALPQLQEYLKARKVTPF